MYRQIKNELSMSRLYDTCIHTYIHIHYTLCSKKSDAKIQITITTAYLIRIKYPLSGFNYHLSDVNVATFNKMQDTVSEQQDAQLSQGDHAAGCIIVFAKSRRLELGDNILRTL